jgi:hypothetical protein
VDPELPQEASPIPAETTPSIASESSESAANPQFAPDSVRAPAAESLSPVPSIRRGAIDPPAPVPGNHPDRRGWIIFFGVVQILLGALCALLTLLFLLSTVLTHRATRGPMHIRQQGMLLVYGLFAAAFIALGIGSLHLRRWARALTLVASWYGLLTGILVTVLFTAILPVASRMAMRAQSSQGPGADSMALGFLAVLITLLIVVFAFFLIVVPLAFVIFYSRNDVLLTFRAHDPAESWTDRLPLPVLGASLLFGAGGAYSLLFGFLTPLFPFFGRFYSGIAGGAGLFAIGLLDLFLAVAIFRRNRTAWWVALVTYILRFVSVVLTYSRADIWQAYAKLGWSDAQIQAASANPIFHSHVLVWWSTFSMVGVIGYLLWLKRFFRPQETSFEPATGVVSAVG